MARIPNAQNRDTGIKTQLFFFVLSVKLVTC